MSSDGAIFPGADERTPSLAQYFSWINNTNEGATEAQTLINLAFFEWLYDEFGMKLDIYAFDAGAIDGAGYYGSTKSERFKRQFPRGITPLVAAAARFGCRLGIWGGPDGFGDTEEEARERIAMMAGLCRDHQFMLFKFDSVCGDLRPDKVKYFIEMMTECRKYSPDLILLNHRLELGEGLPHATTFLWEGMETYIDVHNTNPVPAPHNRVGVMERGLPPELKRLTEDHGVCLSSCLDYWEDDLILQAFSRCLILAPEIYGNPWLLRDDEFPRLARIYNLHRRYRDILVNGMVLSLGQHAVGRGDGQTRFVTLRNLTWEPVTVRVTLDESIGLVAGETVELRRMHPRETILGRYCWGETVPVEVLPFRACLLMATTGKNTEIGFEGCDGEIVSDLPGRDAELILWGLPGTTADVRITGKDFQEVRFAGEPLREKWHRKLGDLQRCDVPADALALYEATCFAADNNALEVRELQRSGPTKYQAVQRARDAFFEQETFKRRGVWDQNLFNDDPESFFAVNRRLRGGALRLDFGTVTEIDELLIEVGGDYNLQPLKNHEGIAAWVAADLKSWTLVRGFIEEDIRFKFRQPLKIRYVRMRGPDRVNKVRGFCRGKALERTGWRASNLFALNFKAEAAWQTTVLVAEIHAGSYLAVPVYGPHVAEGVYAAARCEGRYLGAARRAPSYPSNVWEGGVRPGRNYTYFIPLRPEHAGKPIEVVLLGLKECTAYELRTEVWITAYPTPHVGRRVTLKLKKNYEHTEERTD